MKKFYFTIFIFIYHLSFSQINSFKISIDSGKIYLNNYDFKDNKNISLEGNWEFYWSKLLTPKDFEDSTLKPENFITVPGVWTNIIINGKPIPDTGFATLRLQIYSDTTYPYNISLFFREILTSYKVFLNGKEIIELGKVGKSSTEAIPKLSIKFKTVEIKKGKNDLIVQVSNYHHRTNAFDDPPKIGEEKNILMEILESIAFDLIILGLLLVMSFYHIGLFVFRRKNRVALTFGIFSLIIAIRVLSTSNFILSFLIPSISWQIMYILAYTTIYTTVPLFALYFKQTFEEKRFKWIFFAIYPISLIFLLTLFLPSLIYTKLLLFFQIITILYIIFISILLIIYSIKKRKGAKILLISVLFLGYTVINDFLLYNDIIYTFSMVQIGFFILLLGQALTLAKIFTDAFEQKEMLSKELEIQNQNLEEIIGIRTKQLKEQNEELIVTEEELRQTLEEFKTLNKRYEQKNLELQKYFTAIEQSEIAFVITDLNTIIEYVNPYFSTITGYSSEEIIGKPVKILNSDKTPRIVYDELWKKLNEGKTWKGEFINKAKDGHIFVENAMISPVYFDGKLVNYVAVKEDITELKRKDKEIQDKNQMLEQLNIEIRSILNDLMDSINYAKTIQKSVFPSKIEMKEILGNYFLLFKPRDIVGGDFFFVRQINNFKIIAIGDCTGHGVSGGFLTIMATSLLIEYTNQIDKLTTNQILEKMRARTKLFFSNDSITLQDGFDIALVVWEKENNIIKYSGANIPIYFYTNNKIIEYKPTISPIGDYPIERRFIEHQIEINHETIMYITTDGIVDQLNEDYRKISKIRFLNLLQEISNFDMDIQKEKIQQFFEQWRGSIRQIDDVTILGVKLK